MQSDIGLFSGGPGCSGLIGKAVQAGMDLGLSSDSSAQRQTVIHTRQGARKLLWDELIEEFEAKARSH